jgi:hypothetical protein
MEMVSLKTSRFITPWGYSFCPAPISSMLLLYNLYLVSSSFAVSFVFLAHSEEESIS